MLDVMIRMVFLKSTVLPWESVIRPSSSTCSSTLNTSGCAFSISSNRTTRVRFSAALPLSAGRLPHIPHIPEALRSVWTRSISPCTHSYRYAPYCVSSSNRLAASALASSVLPTPVGPRNRKEPMGLVGSLMPALERMMASVTFCHALILADDPFMQFLIQMQCLISLTLRQLCHRNAGPTGNDPCDFLLGYRFMNQRQILGFSPFPPPASSCFFSCGRRPYCSSAAFSRSYFCCAVWICLFTALDLLTDLLQLLHGVSSHCPSCAFLALNVILQLCQLLLQICPDAPGSD